MDPDHDPQPHGRWTVNTMLFCVRTGKHPLACEELVVDPAPAMLWCNCLDHDMLAGPASKNPFGGLPVRCLALVLRVRVEIRRARERV
jgi:hypothetical protein